MNIRPRHYLTAAAGLLGAVLAFASPGESLLLTLLRPFALLGQWLRSLSLSGAAGNHAAWACVTAVSLLPVLYILIVRRRRRQKDDVLWLIAGAGVFVCLFLLVNPTLAVHPELLKAGNLLSDELLSMAPAMTLLSLLAAAIIARWSGGLRDERLSRWLGALLAVMMALIAMTTAQTAITAFRTPEAGVRGALPGYLTDLYAAQQTGRAPGILLALVPLIPNLFLLWTLDGAAALAHEAGVSLLSDRTGACASTLAMRARVSLIASVVCMAAENTLMIAFAGMIADTDITLSLPLTETALSLGALLLARLIESACRIRRENDLMI